MAKEYRKYSNVTPEMVKALRAKLEEKGIDVPSGNHIVIKHQGYKIECDYSVDKQILYVLVDPPPLFPIKPAWEIVDPAIGTSHEKLKKKWHSI